MPSDANFFALSTLIPTSVPYEIQGFSQEDLRSEQHKNFYKSNEHHKLILEAGWEQEDIENDWNDLIAAFTRIARSRVNEIVRDHEDIVWLGEGAYQGRLELVNFLQRLASLRHLLLESLPQLVNAKTRPHRQWHELDAVSSNLTTLTLRDVDDNCAQTILSGGRHVKSLTLMGKSLHLIIPTFSNLHHLHLQSYDPNHGTTQKTIWVFELR